MKTCAEHQTSHTFFCGWICSQGRPRRIWSLCGARRFEDARVHGAASALEARVAHARRRIPCRDLRLARVGRVVFLSFFPLRPSARGGDVPHSRRSCSTSGERGRTRTSTSLRCIMIPSRRETPSSWMWATLSTCGAEMRRIPWRATLRSFWPSCGRRSVLEMRRFSTRWTTVSGRAWVGGRRSRRASAPGPRQPDQIRFPWLHCHWTSHAGGGQGGVPPACAKQGVVVGGDDGEVGGKVSGGGCEGESESGRLVVGVGWCVCGVE